MGIWSNHFIEKNEDLGIQIGPLTTWIQRTSDEWLIGWLRETNRDDQLTMYQGQPTVFNESPPDIEWNRWAANTNDTHIQIKPTLPDRPIVARPVSPFRLPPGRSAHVFIRIPLWIELSVMHEKKSIVLCEIPVITLSNTWFGDPVSGELCYSLATHARREIPETPLDPHRAICSLIIRNVSKTEELHFERVCLRAPHLSLFEVGSRIWTNEIQVIFNGLDHISDVQYSTKAPEVEGVGVRLNEPRQIPTRALLNRSFSNFRS